MNLASLDVYDQEVKVYVIALVVSGVLLLATALIGFGSTAGARVLNAIVGLVALGYAGYIYFAEPDTVRIFLYAFILPALLIINVFRSRKAKEEAGAGTPSA